MNRLDDNGWICTQVVSHSQCLNRWEPLRRMDEHAFSEWVALQRWSRSEPLITMDEHHLGCESLSSVGADRNYWWERVNTYPESESLSCVWVDQNPWQERVTTHPASESHSSLWADRNHWQEWVKTHPGCEFLSSVWANWNLTRTTPIQQVSPSPVFEQIRTLTRMGEHSSRKSVPLQCLSRSEPDENIWTPI